MNDYNDPYASQYLYTDPRNPPPGPPQPPQYPVASTSQLPTPPSLPRPAVGWAGQIGYEGMGLPPGGSILVSSANGQLPKTLPGGTELVKVTAKCDRRYPECARCTKRKEACDYGDDVSIALRPNWVSPADEDLITPAAPMRTPFSTTTPLNRPSYASSSQPYPSRPPPQQTYDSYPRPPNRGIVDLPRSQALVHGFGRRANGKDENEEANGAGTVRQWDVFLQASNLGESSSSWRLALPSMASSLTIHLIDASMHSCCFHLPAFHIFSPEVSYFKSNIDRLDIAGQVIVGILTSLGARASPHSALLGIAGPDIENGQASHDLVLSAGHRRENAWRAIVKRATEVCTSLEILEVASARNLQTLTAFVQMLMLAEVKPTKARFFLRTAMGLYRDMQQQNSDLSAAQIREIKNAVGPTLFESDSRIAAYLSMMTFISDDDLDQYFDGTGVHVPDLATEELGSQLDAILESDGGRVTSEKLNRALALIGYFVCSIQRCFAKISSSRNTGAKFLTAIPDLWDYIDRAHQAVQKFHRTLVSLTYTPDGCDDHHTVDYDLLIAVRMDERLLDIVHLAHVWLLRRTRDDLTPSQVVDLDMLLAVSDRRVRKCLKLLAFYSKVFVDSLDKHCVYHLFTQLECLPNWATLAAQRVDEMTPFGPLSEECALTETELDWFSRALELACFFTPLAQTRLKELTTARTARRPPANYDAFNFDLSVPPQPSAQLPPPPVPPTSAPYAPSLDAHPLPPPLPYAPNATWNFDHYGRPLSFQDGPVVGEAPETDSESPTHSQSSTQGTTAFFTDSPAATLDYSTATSRPAASANALPPAVDFVSDATAAWISGNGAYDYSTGLTPTYDPLGLDAGASIIEQPSDVVAASGPGGANGTYASGGPTGGPSIDDLRRQGRSPSNGVAGWSSVEQW
ncbi:zn(2)-C6 fungal-type transcription factor [Rhodotorula toruloides]|uniref:Zn(2)-C6 fungal-type transcription factor n=1 Tax=Rhodotorula toruloides TaxID=5286 RepID=A0A511KB27_RHOTO|nr:zn(2)-C6 fungal-type transcription factor [Rhodotorula toruloides]